MAHMLPNRGGGRYGGHALGLSALGQSQTWRCLKLCRLYPS